MTPVICPNGHFMGYAPSVAVLTCPCLPSEVHGPKFIERAA